MPETQPKPDIKAIARKIRRESEGPDPSLKASHERAHQERVAFLKTDPSFRAMLRVLSRMPALQREILDVIRRKEGFKKRTINPGERHRDLTALFAGLLSSQKGKDLFEWALERSVTAEAALLKEFLRNQKNRTRELVIGTGIHGTAYLGERKIYRPEEPSLVIEKEKHIGGQFAQADGALWDLNSRKRPKDLTEAPIPGTKGALNDLGDHAVMQESDVGSRAYDSQEPLAMANEVNARLSGAKIVNKTRLLSQREDPRTKEIVATSIDEGTGELYTTRHERTVYMGGLGDEIIGLEETDPETALILAEAREDLARGEIPQVMTFPMYEKIASDRTNAFPLDGMKDAVVVADGDGTRIIAGALLGHEFGVGKQSTQLHFLEKLTWIGQGATTRKEFFAKERPRYVAVGQDFPRPEEADNYYSRVEAKPDLRSARLRRNGKKIEVICTDKDGKYVSGGMGDRVFLATGFKDTYEKTYGAIYADKFTKPQEIERQLPFFLYRIGNAITYKSGPYKGAMLEVVDIQPEKVEAPEITCRFFTSSGKIQTYQFKNTRLGRRDSGIDTVLEGKLRNPTDGPIDPYRFLSIPGNFVEFQNGAILEVARSVPSVIPGRCILKLTREDSSTEKVTLEYSFPLQRAFFRSDYGDIRDIQQLDIVPATLPTAETVTNNKGKPIARRAAPKDDSNFGPAIYIGGPPAKLPLTEAEKELPAFQIGPNTASIFRYIGPTQELARSLAKSDQQNPRKATKNDLPIESTREKVRLPNISKIDRRDASFNTPRNAPRERDRFPHDADQEMALRLAIAEVTDRYDIPKSFFERVSALTLSIKWMASANENISREYKVTMQPGLPEPYRRMVEAIIQDPLVQSVLAFIMNRKRGLQDVTLRIPTRKVMVAVPGSKDRGESLDTIRRQTRTVSRFDVGNITYTTS